jgi:sugar/nucleoside kinase (ribokinase family)
MKVLCVGEMMVDLVVHPVEHPIGFKNEAFLVKNIDIQSGGDANNNAVNFAKLGNRVTYCGLIGNDEMGDFVISSAAKYGIDMSHAKRSKTTGQSRTVILVNSEGNRTFIQYSGSSPEFSFDDIDTSLLDETDCLVIGGTFHMPSFDGEGTRKLLELAREKKVITAMDVTNDFTGRWNSVIKDCYPYLDYFLPSIEQAQAISGYSTENETADFFLQRGVKTAVIKYGEKGSYFKTAGKAFHCGIYHVPVAEPTGAGDAFVAGFLTAVGNGKEPEEAVRFASAVSAFAVQAYGATAGVPDSGTVEAFIRKNPAPKITYD